MTINYVVFIYDTLAPKHSICRGYSEEENVYSTSEADPGSFERDILPLILVFKEGVGGSTREMHNSYTFISKIFWWKGGGFRPLEPLLDPPLN